MGPKPREADTANALASNQSAFVPEVKPCVAVLVSHGAESRTQLAFSELDTPVAPCAGIVVTTVIPLTSSAYV